jgi:hypothetical protein
MISVGARWGTPNGRALEAKMICFQPNFFTEKSIFQFFSAKNKPNRIA